MLELDVTLDEAVFASVSLAATTATDDDQLAAAISALAEKEPVFGANRRAISASPGKFFPLSRMRDEAFWHHQRALLAHMREHLGDSVRAVIPFLPPVPDERPVPVTVHPVPGFTSCYGSSGGHQVFGLFDGADAREMLLFCSHTYMHEAAGHINTRRSAQAEADPRTADALIHLILMLIRNEGVANFAVLEGVRALLADGVSLPYFDYAHMIDDDRATRHAMAACRQLLARVRTLPAAQTGPRVTEAFKNPKLPVINLVGIRTAEAIAGRYGVGTLVDIADADPQEFFECYARTDDPLAAELFGSGGEHRDLFGVPPAPAVTGLPWTTGSAGSGDLTPIDLTLGAPVFPATAAFAAGGAVPQGDAARDAARYAPMGGLPDLREALAAKLRSRNKIDATADDVVVTPGASGALFASLLALTRPGDRILVPDPGFPLYRLAAASLRLQVIPYRLARTADGGYAPDFVDLAEAVAGTRVMLWNFPSNPLGAIPEARAADQLASLLRAEARLTVVSDEVYEDFVFDGAHLSPAAALPADLASRVWSVFSFSKSYGVAGIRVGYVHAPAGHAANVARLSWATTMSTGTLSQEAALGLLRAGPGDAVAFRDQVRAARDLAVARLREAGLPATAPQAGLFCWVDVSATGLAGEVLAERASRECGVLFLPGTEFSPGAPAMVRLSFGGEPAALREALDRLVPWLAPLVAGARSGPAPERAAADAPSAATVR
jgi:aspartate/methionine/tyrosine aminotransferase